MRVSNPNTSGVDSSREAQGVSKAKGNAKKNSRVSHAENLENSDKVQLSSKGKDVAKAKSAAMSAPDVNEEKVARIREQLKNGTYKVDADKIADRMVDEHMKTMV